jgi:hypothetical protein
VPTSSDKPMCFSFGFIYLVWFSFRFYFTLSLFGLA